MEKKLKFSVSTLIGCVAAQLCVGVLDMWSVFKATAMGHYGWEDGPLNLVAAFMLMSFCIGNLLGGILQDRTNPRLSAVIGICLFSGGYLLSSFIPADGSIAVFYVTYCIMGGLGSGFVHCGVLNCLQKWLPHRRGLATGVASSAFGLSMVILSPVSSALLNVMSMPSTLRTLACVLFVIGLTASLFISLPSQEYLDSLKLPAVSGAMSGKDIPTLQAMKTVPFWCLFLSSLFFNATWTTLSPLIKGLGIERGLSAGLAVLAVSLSGATNSAGRLLMSILSDRLGRIATLNILCVITLLCALGLTFAGGSFYLIVVLLTAFAQGGPASVNPALCTDLFGLKHAGANYGVIILSLGVTSVIFNAVSNVLYAATGNYVMTFLVGAVTAVLAILMVMVIHYYVKKEDAKVKA